MGKAVEWLGFDEMTVILGTRYSWILLGDALLNGWGECIHGLLDVSNHETYSTIIGASEELLAFLIILVWALVDEATIMTVGFVQLIVGIIFFILNILIIVCKGWFRPYKEGMLKSFGLKVR